MSSLSSLNPPQRQAVETTDGPVLILAGAGSGKTRVITCRVARLVEKGVAPGNILAVTFTNKAAREMQERVRPLLPRAPKAADGKKPDRPTICTFHSLCVRILRQHIERLGYKRNFVIYSGSDQLATIKKLLSRVSAKGIKMDAYEILGEMSRFKNCAKYASGPANSDAGALARHLLPQYQSALRACNAVDFDDLILLTLQLFDEHPDALAACRAKYRYVMVDEYQDTNAAQFKLIHQLTAVHQNLCVVGDDDQSIYGWRGAEIANLLDMEKYFPKLKIVLLQQNYRSTTTILNAANAVIKNNLRRRSKQLWSQNGEGRKILLQVYKDDEEEAARTVEQIEFARMAHAIPWEQQAILFRTNQQSRPVEMALRKSNVRYHLIGGQSYFDRREVKDFLAFLRMFVNPDDDVSLLRIANVPARGLSDATMERLLAASQERNCPVFTVMKHTDVLEGFNGTTGRAIGAFRDFITREREKLQTGAPSLQQWAAGWLEEIKYEAELRRSEKNPEAADNRIANLRELASTLSGTPVDPMTQLQDFLDDLTLDGEREHEKELTGDAVTLITMHSCKGLEFPHVYIVGLEQGLLPHSRSLEGDSLDEERRLFYVAITRAMKTLTLSHCAARKKYGSDTPCHPSIFLREIPADLVETEDDKSKKPVSAEDGKKYFAALRMAAS